MNLEQISTFLTVYQSGSYKKAAELLYLPQPTVSHRINQLEKELGKSLLLRGKGKVKLTEEGKAFLPYARRILGAIKEGQEAVERVGEGATGKLSIGCNNSFAAYVLPNVMDSFTRDYPHVSIKVYTYASSELVRLMKNQHFQLGITRYTSNDSGMIYRPILSEHVMLLVSPEHRFAKRSSVKLEEILQEPILTYPKETQYRKMIDVTLNQFNLTYQAKLETNNLQLIKHFLKRNAGVFLSGRTYMMNEIKEKELVQVEIENNPFPLSQVFIAYRENELHSLDYLFIKHFEERINQRVKEDTLVGVFHATGTN
ncbi:LysR family transcriptional regulator [Paenibacillus prosopidis]|uniref:DNA-binding transcriptional LysR family regulator n=1 Tax=Paenibacillus prosopidis TaxID=630520 RepID=A0A368W2L5_9BACL|nr:LysR family transcriptional regulator [Paenibacillus prosopidis]RCW48323.1 DNA-binding transcriptional LysR family regulator [Paenibacillus prosopidis]